MSKMSFNLIPAARRGDVASLQSVIVKLENHLKGTNEKLGNFRQLIRTESNEKSRKIYLNKVYTMVKEQHTIQSILANYKIKLKELESRKKLVGNIQPATPALSGKLLRPQKLEMKTAPQQTKNAKLFELFHNFEPIEARIENKSVRKRKLTDTETIVKLEQPVTKIIIDNHGVAIRSLKAHVRKRINEDASKQTSTQIVRVETKEDEGQKNETDKAQVVEPADQDEAEANEDTEAEGQEADSVGAEQVETEEGTEPVEEEAEVEQTEEEVTPELVVEEEAESEQAEKETEVQQAEKEAGTEQAEEQLDSEQAEEEAEAEAEDEYGDEEYSAAAPAEEKKQMQILSVSSIEKLISINNHEEAMQCLKALQEYAMLKENFRVIGLLTQAEKVLINPPNDTDFEV